jgi:hypothetical protein
VIAAFLVAGMFMTQAFGSTASTRTYIVFLLNVTLVVSMQSFIGNSGIVSFGHVALRRSRRLSCRNSRGSSLRRTSVCPSRSCSPRSRRCSSRPSSAAPSSG